MHDNTFMNQIMHRKMPATEQLPYALYTAEQVRHFDELAINQYGIAAAELMQRAGLAAFQALTDCWPDARHLTVVTGSGNNAGDGFVLARLAVEAGISVRLLELGDRKNFSDETRQHAKQFDRVSSASVNYEQLPKTTDVIVDAILGTGLNSPVTGKWRQAIMDINRHSAAVLSLDIPSGLSADTGRVMGVSVKADLCISFIGLKRGMFTGDGRELCGEIKFHALDIPAKIYASRVLNCRRFDWHKLKAVVAPRPGNAHKGQFGHVLVIGGDVGFQGAARLSAEAAARSGAGLVSVATHPFHAAMLNAGCPELMVHPVNKPAELEILLGRASVIVVGPGLGQSAWGQMLFEAAINCRLPLVLDADGLNLLAQMPDVLKDSTDDIVFTPHPGEAARLMQSTVAEIEADRFLAVEQLQQRFGGSFVLKGAGSLVASGGNKPLALCSAGNPGMASGGMGDVLSGIIAAMLAQGLEPDEAVCAGVALHAEAGDVAACNGEIGMLASDLFKPVRELINAG